MARMKTYDPFATSGDAGDAGGASSGGGSVGGGYGINPGKATLLIVLLAAGILFIGLLFLWFGCRIEPGAGRCAVLIHKSGVDIPANDIIATRPDQKGILLDTLSEGRYFYNPVDWDWKIVPYVRVAENQVGILVRRFGAKPPAGQFIVPEGAVDGILYRGIIDQPLRPGTYRINPYAYDVATYPAVKVNPGEVGVVTLRYGKEPVQPNAILVKDGERGVQPTSLRPGTYYLNPFITRVDIVRVQSHKTEFEISFLSRDGFRFPVNGAVEWAVDEDHAPTVFVTIGDEEDIVAKVILRSALSMSRIQGSKYTSADVINGTIRKRFQDEFAQHITAESAKKDILVKAALVSNIEPPPKISDPIRAKQIAVQTRDKYVQEIERAQSEAQVAQQQMMQTQKIRVVLATTILTNAIQKVTKDQQVAVIGAQRDLDVAKKDLETAEKVAQGIIATGKGDADAIRFTRLAEAKSLKAQIAPFGDGLSYARYLYLLRVAPNIDSLMATTDGPLAAPFRSLSSFEPNKK